MKDKFEWLCRQNSVVAEYLDKCHFSEVDGQYVLTVHDYDMLYMEDRLNGAWWAYQECQSQLQFKSLVINRQRKTIELLQEKKTRKDAQHDFDDLG